MKLCVPRYSIQNITETQCHSEKWDEQTLTFGILTECNPSNIILCRQEYRFYDFENVGMPPIEFSEYWWPFQAIPNSRNDQKDRYERQMARWITNEYQGNYACWGVPFRPNLYILMTFFCPYLLTRPNACRSYVTARFWSSAYLMGLPFAVSNDFHTRSSLLFHF